MATESDDFATLRKSDKDEAMVIHQLADAARAYNWQKVFEISDRHPDLINATRPGGKLQYTPLHQAAHGNASPEVIQKLLALGASLTLRNAENERAIDIAERKGHQPLIQLLKPVQEALEETSLLHFPNDIVKAQSICALRFQGYEYEKSIGISSGGETIKGLPELIAPVVNELTLHGSNNENFAAFFGLQRYLSK